LGVVAVALLVRQMPPLTAPASIFQHAISQLRNDAGAQGNYPAHPLAVEGAKRLRLKVIDVQSGKFVWKLGSIKNPDRSRGFVR